MLRALGCSLVTFVASVALADPAPQVTSGKLEFPSAAETISGVLARPVEPLAKGAGPPRRPALLLIHEWWGLNDFARKKAEHFAKLGYVVLAPDLYRGQVATDAEIAHQLSRGMPHDRALRDLSAAIDALIDQPGVDRERIAVVGWCMGGSLAGELATSEARLKGLVLYYGAVPSDRMAISRIKAAVLGNYGAQDRGIPEASLRSFELQLRKQGNPIDLKIYPEAGHAFASSTRPEVYKPEAARDADARTEAFLRKWLRP